MFPLQQPKMPSSVAIGGKLAAKKGKKCKVCGNITVGHFPLSVALEKKNHNTLPTSVPPRKGWVLVSGCTPYTLRSPTSQVS